MVKQSSILLLALLVSIPGCGGRKDKMKPEMSKKGSKMYAQKTGDETMVTADASDDMEIDDAVRSFFNDMEEFVSFGDGSDESAPEKSTMAWQDADDEAQLDPVYFGFNKIGVDRKEQDKLAANIDRVKEVLADADAKLVVEGYACTSAGDEKYNKFISEKRAKTITEKLVEAGVPADRITAVGRGTENLLVTEGDREDQAPNRRVELHVVYS